MINFQTDIFTKFNNQWALLCAGDLENHNAMTISWGSMGTLWSKPIATVYVKPCRYTYEYMNNNDYFTVSFYNEQYHDALAIMGTISGRDENKDLKANLDPVEVSHSVTYKQAETTILCKKIYCQNLDIDNIPLEFVKAHYTIDKPHCMFIGEVVEIIE